MRVWRRLEAARKTRLRQAERRERWGLARVREAIRSGRLRLVTPEDYAREVIVALPSIYPTPKLPSPQLVNFKNA